MWVFIVENFYIIYGFFYVDRVIGIIIGVDGNYIEVGVGVWIVAGCWYEIKVVGILVRGYD